MNHPRWTSLLIGAGGGLLLFAVCLMVARLTAFPLEITSLAAFVAGGTLTGWACGTMHLRAEHRKGRLRQFRALLASQAILDEVTGLYNQRCLLQEIDRELKRAARYQHALSGMMVRVDHFEALRRDYGSAVGDETLKQVASVLKRSIRQVDIIGRYGDHEFLVILPESSAEVSWKVGERLRKNIREHPFEMQHRMIDGFLPISVSVGLFALQEDPKANRTDLVEWISELAWQHPISGTA